MSTGPNSLKMDKELEEIKKKTQRLPSSKFTPGLEPLLVEIEHFLDTTQKYETPGFFIFKCQNAHFSWKVDIFETNRIGESIEHYLQ